MLFEEYFFDVEQGINGQPLNVLRFSDDAYDVPFYKFLQHF